MFNLRVPESMKRLPGRLHVESIPTDRPKLRKKRRDGLYYAVMRELKQCECGECFPENMVKHHGYVRSICKRCNTAKVQAYYARNGRPSRPELRAGKGA